MKNKDYLRKRAESLLTMSEGESIVKTYHVVTMNNGESETFLTLTDRRLALTGISERDRNVERSEVSLNAVEGMKYSYRRAGVAGKVLGVALFLMAAAVLVALPFLIRTLPDWADYVMWGGAGLCALLSLICASLRPQHIFRISILTSPLQEMSHLSSVNRRTLNETIFRLDLTPAEDCEAFVREFGAIVADIRTQGAACRGKYLRRAEQKELRVERKLEERRLRDEAEREQERTARREEKERRIRLKEQRRLDKASERLVFRDASEEKDPSGTGSQGRSGDFFDILNK